MSFLKLGNVKLNREVLFGLLILFLAVAVVLVPLLMYGTNNQKEKTAQYRMEYTAAIESISVATLKYESISSLITAVSHNCIDHTSSVETDMYTKDANGEFFDDVNTAVMVLYGSDEFKADMDELTRLYDDANLKVKTVTDDFLHYSRSNPFDSSLFSLKGYFNLIDEAYNSIQQQPFFGDDPYLTTVPALNQSGEAKTDFDIAVEFRIKLLDSHLEETKRAMYKKDTW